MHDTGKCDLLNPQIVLKKLYNYNYKASDVWPVHLVYMSVWGWSVLDLNNLFFFLLK